VTASGVFVEMQTALNAIWKATPKGTTVSQLIRARAASLGLVAALGFLLMVSLVVSTELTAFGNYLDSILPFGKIIMTVLNVVVSLTLISFLFAAIYKILPDRDLKWGDVVVVCCLSCRDYINRHRVSSSLGNNCRRGPYQLLVVIDRPDYDAFGGSLCTSSGHSCSTSSRISSETSERPSVSRRNLYSRSKSSCIMMWSEIIRGA
jgi:Virulence factor BrkB